MADPVRGLPQPDADEALLDELAQALRPMPLRPPPASVAALRRAVQKKKWRPTARTRVKGQLVAWARRLQRTGVALVLFGGVALGGVTIAGEGSMADPVQDVLHDLGIPVSSPGAHQDNRGRPAQPSVNVGPPAAPTPAATPPARPSAKPATAVSQIPAPAAPPMPVALAPPTAPSASPNDKTTPPPGSAPPVAYRDRPLAWNGQPISPTGNPLTYRAYGAYWWANQPAPGTASPAPPAPTRPTSWSGTTTNTGSWQTWQTGSGWPQTSTGGFTTTSSAPPTTTANLSYPQRPDGVSGLRR